MVTQLLGYLFFIIMSNQSVAEKWKEALKDTGYEHGKLKEGDCRKLRRLSRVWRRIFRFIRLEPNQAIKVFEAGCGGAKHLIPFALNGAKCVGLDFSPEVLKRAQAYVDEVEKVCGEKLNIKLLEGDFLNCQPPDHNSYDIVFHSGVIEHFLDDAERLTFVKNMFALARPGGYVVSIVPSGTHPLRERMKNLKLGGYGIPEIDYNPKNMSEELKKCGGKNIVILPHNIFGYLLIDNTGGLKKKIQKVAFYFFQLVPISLLPYEFAVRHAGTLIGIACKK